MTKQLVAIILATAFGVAHAADVKPAAADMKAATAPVAATVKEAPKAAEAVKAPVAAVKAEAPKVAEVAKTPEAKPAVAAPEMKKDETPAAAKPAAKPAAKAKKARSGRPVTIPGLTKALKGESLSGPYKLRVLHAVARIAEQKKLAAPELANLF